MIVRLLSVQIAQYWDVIKHSLQQVERIGSDETDVQFNNLFASLLSDKSQCFLKHADGQIHAVMITEVYENSITLERVLKLRSLYAYTPFATGEWQESFKIIKDLAKSERCNSLKMESKHPKILAVAESIGFTVVHTTMVHTLGD